MSYRLSLSSLQSVKRNVNCWPDSLQLFENVQKFYSSKIIITWREQSMLFSLWKKTAVPANLWGNRIDSSSHQRENSSHVKKTFKCNFKSRFTIPPRFERGQNSHLKIVFNDKFSCLLYHTWSVRFLDDNHHLLCFWIKKIEFCIWITRWWRQRRNLERKTLRITRWLFTGIVNDTLIQHISFTSYQLSLKYCSHAIWIIWYRTKNQILMNFKYQCGSKFLLSCPQKQFSHITICPILPLKSFDFIQTLRIWCELSLSSSVLCLCIFQ